MHKDAQEDRGKPNLGEVASAWPTPTSRDWKDGDPSEEVETNALLGRTAPRWFRLVPPTPQDGKPSLNGGPGSRRQWATPNAMDGSRPIETMDEWSQRNQKKQAENEKLGELHLPLTTQVTAMWATPTVGIASGGSLPSEKRRQGGGDRSLGTDVGGSAKLNPNFVDWLMR